MKPSNLDPGTLTDHARLLAGIKAVLVGQPIGLQSSVLAEALALWLAGHPDFLRMRALSRHVRMVRKLVPEVEREVFNGGQHPQNKGNAS